MKTRKIIAVFMIIAMVFCYMPVTALADVASDVAEVATETTDLKLLTTEATSAVEGSALLDMPKEGFWSTAALKAAVSNGLLNGFIEKDGSYIKPDEALTRAQMATIVNRAFGAIDTAALSGVMDVSANAWYYKDMQKAVKMGTMKLDTNMRPNDSITRQEAFTILGRALKMEGGTNADLAKFNDATQVANWATSGMGAMVKAGYIKGDNNLLNPSANMTRAQFAVIMDNVIKEYISNSGTFTELSSGNVTVNVPGVTLKDATIRGDLIVGDGVGDGNLTLNNVIVNGNLIVRGGGVDSIIISGGSVKGKVIIAKIDGKVRVLAEGGAEIKVIEVNDGINEVIIEGNVGTVDVTVATLAGTPVIIRNGVVNNLNVNTNGAGDITVESSAKVVNLVVGKSSFRTKVKVLGTVTNLETSAVDTSISGSGKLDNVRVNEGANDTTITTPNTKIDNRAKGVTGGGGDKILIDTIVTNNTQGTGVIASTSGGSSSGSSSVVVEVSDITVTGEGPVVNGKTLQMGVDITPTTATNQKVTWSVIDGTGSATISTSGLLTGTGVGTVTVKALAQDGSGKEDTKVITIIAAPVTDAEKVATAKANLSLGDISGIVGNMTLPATQNEATVSWASDDTAVIANDGTVTRPAFTEGNTTVTLTATITSGTASDTKEFAVTVIKAEETDAEKLTKAKANLSLGDISAIVENMTLPTTQNDATVSWKSDKEGVVSTTGTVVRPESGAGDATVILTATLTVGSETDTKSFTVTVKEKAATQHTLTLTGDNISSAPGAGLVDNNASVTITVTPAAGKQVTSFTVGGVDKKADLVANKYTFTITSDIEVVVTYEDIKVTGVILDQATLNLVVGGATGTLTATVNPSDAANKAVTWSSSKEAAATVADGVVTPLSAGSTTITVTTDDGGKTATCVVTVTVKSSDASLSDLTVNGTTVTDFSKVKTAYDIELPVGTTTIPTVVATVTDTGKANAIVTNATTLPWKTTVEVTAEDGTKQTYTINFTLNQAAPTSLVGVAPTSTANNDGKITGTTTEMEYKLQSEADTEYKDCSADTTVVGAAGTYVVRVKAKTGYNASSTMTVAVVAYVKSNDASLSALTVDGTAITSFSASTITYNVELAIGTTIVPAVGATANNSKATIAITQASTVTDSATVVVTAEDGTTIKTYTINFTVAPNKVVDKLSLDSLVIKPVKDATPVTTSIDGEQYTGEITWFESDETTAVTGDFAADTVYVAKVTLTAKTGYTFNGVLANKFTYTGATVTNAADSGEVMITFPATAKDSDTAVTATVAGSLTETDPLGPITINLSSSIANLQWNDIKVYINGIETASNLTDRNPSDDKDSVTIQFYSTTGIKYGDEITVTITKSGYSINDGNPITIANNIPGYNLTVVDGFIVSSGNTTGTYIKGARIEIKAEEKAGKVFTKWTYSDTKPTNWDAITTNKEEIIIPMPAGPVTLTPTYTDRKINIDGTIHHLSDVSDPVLPSGLTWDETNKTLNMSDYEGAYIHEETLENITINLEGTNELITEVNIEVLSFSHGITIKGSGKLTLQSPASRLVYQGGISYSTIIEDFAEVTVNILNESAYLGQANGFDGSTIVKGNGKLIVKAPLKSGKEKRRLSVLRSYNITVEDSGSVEVNLATEAGKNNAVYIDYYVPSILGQYNSTERYYEKAAYKVEGSWTASDGTSTNPIKLTYTVADDIATLYTPDTVGTDYVYVKTGSTTHTVKMYDKSFAGSEITNKTLVTGENTIYIKTTIGGVDKYYEITVNRDAAEVAEVLADKAALTADIIKGDNTDLEHITVALSTLPSTGTNGSTIQWESDKPGVVSSDGQAINSPIVGSGSEIVTLTATLKKGTVTETKEFILTVLALEPEALSGTVTIGGVLKFGKELTANLADTNNTGTLSYTWKRGDTTIGSNQATYTTTADDIGETITVEVTSSVETEKVIGTTSGTIGKADGPVAPSEISKTDETKIGLNDGSLTGVASGQEYQVNEAGVWIPITGDTVAGLAPGSYTVRIAETTTHKAGTATSVIVITAGTEKQDGPTAPTEVGKTDETRKGLNDGSLTGVASGQEYQVNGADAWIPITGDTVTGLAPGSYTVRIAETTTHKAGIPTEALVIADSTELQDGPEAPLVESFKISGTVDDMIMLKNDGTNFTIKVGTNKIGLYEYSIGETDSWDPLTPAEFTVEGKSILIRAIETGTHKAGAEAKIILTTDGYVFNRNTGTIINYAGTGTGTGLTIPDTIDSVVVTKIDAEAFKGKELTSVVIPDTIQIIGYQAFMDNNLTSIVIPDSVTFVNTQAFEKNKLIEVTIPSSVSTIGSQAFLYNGPNQNSDNITKTSPDFVGTWRLVGDSTVWVKDFAEGKGTSEDPYQVSSAEELNNVRYYLNAQNVYFVQTGHIDLSTYSNDEGWTPIGSLESAPFKGRYDGQKHEIQNLTINRPSESYQGLFGHYGGASLKNIKLTNANVIGKDSVGGLVGRKTTVQTGKNIENCTVSGSVKGENNVGGLIGDYTWGEVINSYSTCSVEGNDLVGGLIGKSNHIIKNCYATGAVTGATNVGGLVGQESGSDAIITSSYYDKDTTGQSDTGKGEGKTTEQMKQVATFSSWDTDIWNITDGSYPTLK